MGSSILFCSVKRFSELTTGDYYGMYETALINDCAIACLYYNNHNGAIKGALKRKSLKVEECGHEIRNKFHWSQKSRGAEATIIATQNSTSNVAVTYTSARSVQLGLTPSRG